MECKNTRIDDLEKVVKCHLNTFPDALSSKLGERFTKRMLLWYIENERGIIFHIEDGNYVLGYLCGVITPKPGIHGSSTSIVQKNFWQFIWEFFKKPWLIFHPEFVNKTKFIWRNLKIRLGFQKRDYGIHWNLSLSNFNPTMGLVLVGVSPEFQGKGYGSELMQEFESRAIKAGIKRINLSVKSTNQKALAAYKRNGWKINYEGREEYVMYKTLD